MSNGIFSRIFTGDINRFRMNCLEIARSRGYRDDNPVSFPIVGSTFSNSNSRALERTVVVSHTEPDFKLRDLVWIPTDPANANFGKVVQYWGDTLIPSVIDDSNAIWNDYTFEGTRPY